MLVVKCGCVRLCVLVCVHVCYICVYLRDRYFSVLRKKYNTFYFTSVGYIQGLERCIFKDLYLRFIFKIYSKLIYKIWKTHHSESTPPPQNPILCLFSMYNLLILVYLSR